MLIDIFIEKDNVVGIGNVVSFFGSIIGGALTLIGVKWTLDSKERKEKREKYEKANYIFIELLPKFNDVYNEIKSLNPNNWRSVSVKITDNAKELEIVAEKLQVESVYIGIEFYREVKSIQYYAKRIYEYFFDEENEGKTDQEMIEELLVFYSNLAESDNKLFEIVNIMKHS